MIVLLVLAMVGAVVLALLSDRQPRPLRRAPPTRQHDDQAAAYGAWGDRERAGRAAAEREAAEWRMANDPGESHED